MSVIAEDVFKAPRAKKNYMKTDETELWSPRTKRRRRTKDDFVKFCNIVLAYAQYDGIKDESSPCQPDLSLPDPASHGLENQEYRSRHNSSPLDSGGSTAESDGPSDSSNNSIISYIDDNGNESIAAEDDSHDLVTCFCGKPFAGRPMIECNACFTWVHLSCAKIRKTNIPETFTCQPCRDGSSQARKSDRHGNQKQSYSPTFP